jgi:hypothetical protein
VAEQPGPQRRELVSRGVWQYAFGVLGLPSGTLRGRDEGPGAAVRRRRPVVPADQVQAQSMPVVTPAEVRMSPSST